MYSQNIFVSTRLIECILIVGVKHIELQRKIIFIYKILKKNHRTTKFQIKRHINQTRNIIHNPKKL